MSTVGEIGRHAIMREVVITGNRAKCKYPRHGGAIPETYLIIISYNTCHKFLKFKGYLIVALRIFSGNTAKILIRTNCTHRLQHRTAGQLEQID